MLISESCTGHFVNYLGHSEFRRVQSSFPGKGLGALPTFNRTFYQGPQAAPRSVAAIGILYK